MCKGTNSDRADSALRETDGYGRPDPRLHGKVSRPLWATAFQGELEDEIQLHIPMLKDRFILQGMEPRDAEAAARRQFGNPALLRERHHEQRTFFLFVTLIRDLRFGLRQLWRNPILTSVAIASLALGIGANTAIFTAAKHVLFDTLPVARPAQLRMLAWVSGPERPVPRVWGDVGPNEAGGLISDSFSYPVLDQMRSRSDAVQALIAFKDVPMAATIDGQAEIVSGELISGNAFESLGPARFSPAFCARRSGSRAPASCWDSLARCGSRD